ncbi:MAG: class I SAM-dependent methyltransferase [Pseudomonadota bacterium]
MTKPITRQEGRALFGLNPSDYDDARPDYPDALYKVLLDRQALYSGCCALEIGAGNGLATRKLLALGANPITVIEPDIRFRSLLNTIAQSHQANFRLIQQSFEEAALTEAHYDLVACATAFHWLDPETGINKIASILKPGGYVALWWNVFQDLDKADPFHEATRSLLAPLSTNPSGAPDTLPFALDRQARESSLANTGLFEHIEYHETRWTLVLDTSAVGKLYGSFSGLLQLPEAEQRLLLEKLMDIAQHEFNGRVERHTTSPLYLARRIAANQKDG